MVTDKTWQVIKPSAYPGPTSPHISPMDAMIAPDLSRQRVPATESIAVVLVEEARARWRDKDQRGRIRRSLSWRQSDINPDNLLTPGTFPLTTSELVRYAG